MSGCNRWQVIDLIFIAKFDTSLAFLSPAKKREQGDPQIQMKRALKKLA
jgi:hypothetical protein